MIHEGRKAHEGSSKTKERLCFFNFVSLVFFVEEYFFGVLNNLRNPRNPCVCL